MKRIKLSKLPVLRAAVIIALVSLLVTGVTFAALQSEPATLTQNTIESATAGLEIGTTPDTFADSQTGFQFTNVVPGGPAVPADGYTIYLENSGGAKLQVSLSIPNAPENTASVNLADVSLSITRIGLGTEPPQTASLQSLLDGNLTLTDKLAPGDVAQYSIRVSMDADAFDGTSASIGAFDIVFSGTVPPTTE